MSFPPAPAEPDAPFRNDRIDSRIPGATGQFGQYLEPEPDPDRDPAASAQEPVVVAAAEPDPVPARRERHPGHEHEVRGRGIDARVRADRRLGDPEPASLEGRLRADPVELEARAPAAGRSHDPRERDGLPLGQRAAHEGTGIGLAAHRRVGEHDAGAAPRRQPEDAARDGAAAAGRAPGGLGLAHRAQAHAHGLFRGNEVAGRHRGHSTSVALAALLALPVLLTGCLPILLGSAKVLHPGEFSLAVAGLGRTHDLPAGVQQTGPAAAIAEFRGGLPGDVLDAGFTVQAPWNLDWDLKLQVVQEGTWTPAVAARADLGVLQPSFGGALLASKSSGPLTVTAMAGAGRRSERLWRNGSSPFAMDSESLTKNVWSWGVEADWTVSGVHDIFVGVVGWNSTGETESPKSAPAFRVNEGPTLFFTAGIRIRWKTERSTPKSLSTALRGYVLTEPAADRFDFGQPGIYRAAVLIDGYTRITADGKPAPRSELRQGRAVLIQGIALPQPSTFLARTIELQ